MASTPDVVYTHVEIACADLGSDQSLAFIGSDSARDDRVGSDADAESLSITRLEGSRWRGGRLWSHELGSESVSESESRPSAPWIDASRSVSVGVHGARGDNTARDTSGSRQEHRGRWAHVAGW